MEKQEFSNVDILIFGTLGMLILVLGLIIFVLIYRKKLQEKKSHMVRVQRSYQKQLVDSVVLAKEKEQERIAMELHDEVGSKLSAVKLYLNNYNLKSDVKEKLDTDLRDIVVKIRNICNDLYPIVLQELGLCDALRNLCRVLQEDSNVLIEYKSSSQQDLPQMKPDIELALYRIIQESLSNIIKHSSSTEVRLHFEHNPLFTKIEIIDNGIAFDRDEIEIKPGHFGLKNIESRIQQIAAEFVKDDTYENGNRVIITKYYA